MVLLLFGIVFVIVTLGIICLIVFLLLPIFNKISKSIENKKNSKNTTKVSELSNVTKNNIETQSIIESDEAIVAAIIAAISASEKKDPTQFRVVSFKKI